MNRTALQKPRGKFRLRISTQGWRPDDATKEHHVLETVRGISLRWADVNKGVGVLAEGGENVRTRRRRDAVSEI